MNTSVPPMPEDAALSLRFRGVHGGELRIDSMFRVDTAVIVNMDTGYVFNSGMGSFGPRGATYTGYGGNRAGDRLVIPKHLRLVRYPDGASYVGRRPPYFDGKPVVDLIVPVAERIPDETLEELRKNGGGLRLKLRIHPDTLLVGWDIVRRPGYVPGKRDTSEMPIYVPPQFSSIGGDFREAQIFNGRVIEKGWYIDPKTKQRIETDF